MDVRRLGDTGPLVSVVGLGCNNFGMRVDEAGTARVVGAALDAGGRSNQKPMSRYEQRPTPSQPTNISARWFASTSISI